MSKTVRAIKTAFSGAQLRGLDWSPVSPVEQTSFQAIGEAYARGLVGGAVHLRNDPPPPKPAPPLPPAPANQSETRPYRRADLSRPLPGDAALGGFRIYNDVNERNLAIEQAQRGGRS